MTTTRTIHYDFRQKHTIITGMINTSLTAVTAAVIAHAVTKTGVASTLQSALTILAVTILGVMLTLAWATFSRRRPAGLSVTHRIACWVGAGAWTLAFAFRPWSLATVGTYMAGLVASAVALGFMVWVRQPDNSPAALAEAAAREAEYQEGLARDDLATEWIMRIKRVCNLDVEIPNIQNFPNQTKDGRRIGYTLEVLIPAGGASWATLHRAEEKLGNDFDFREGCGLAVRMGDSKRVALVDVTVINTFLEDKPYPTDYSRTSIHDPLLMMTAPDGTAHGPILREENMAIFGIGGSGKSNTAQVIGARVASMEDALLCDIDVTGVRLSMPLMRAYLEGRAEKPAVFWCAFNEDEAFLLLRALQRVAIVRNNCYGDLKVQVNDDKVPISKDIPQFLIRIDEVAHVAGSNGNQLLLQYVRNMVNDHRDAGIRAIFMALRGTNDIIVQQIQAQLHNVGALKAALRSELVAIFGGAAAVVDTDGKKFPGQIMMRLGTDAQISPYHVWRIKPNQLDDVAIAVSGYQPDVDEVSWLAMNGRNTEGVPFDDLEDGELDCAATRWDRLRAHLGMAQRGDAVAVKPADKRSPEQVIADGNGSVDAAMKAAFEVARKLQEEKAVRDQEAQDDLAAYKRSADEIDQVIAGIDLDRELSHLFGTPALAPAPALRADVPANWTAVVDIIREHQQGVSAGQIWQALATRGIVVDRTTVNTWLLTMTAPGAAYEGVIEKRLIREGGRNSLWHMITEGA
jgi:hypothetical protein